MLLPSPAECELEPIPGPAVVVWRNVVPVDLCADLCAGYMPTFTKGGERMWLDPDNSPVFTSIVGQVIAHAEQHWHSGSDEIEGCFMFGLRPGHHDRLRPHFDNEYEGVVGVAGPGPIERCIFSCVFYLSDPKSYKGGDLVIDGAVFRPDAGDVIGMRGDVWHEVRPVTAGERFAAKACVVVPALLERPMW